VLFVLFHPKKLLELGSKSESRNSELLRRDSGVKYVGRVPPVVLTEKA
jgi:hypothetical protein